MPDQVDDEMPIMDTSALGVLLHQRRVDNNLSLRQAAAAAGVSFSTYARVEDGSQPDLATFLRMCEWLHVSPGSFFRSVSERRQSGLDIAIAHLAADPHLDPVDARKITSTLRDMYGALAKQISPSETGLALHLRAATAMRPGVPERLAAVLHDMHDRLVELIDSNAL